VTHDPRAAARAERVLHLDKGRLVDDVQQARGPVPPPAPACDGVFSAEAPAGVRPVQ